MTYPSVIFLLTIIIIIEIIFQSIINLFVIDGMHFDLKFLCLVFYIALLFFYYKKRIFIIDGYVDIVKKIKLFILIPLVLLLSQTFCLSYYLFCVYFNIFELDFNLYLDSNLLTWFIIESHNMEEFEYDSELGGCPSESSYDNAGLSETIILPSSPTLELRRSVEESLPMINEIGTQTVTGEVAPRLPYLIYFLGLGTSLLMGYAGYRYLGSVNPDVIEGLPKIIEVVPETPDAGLKQKVVDALSFQAVISSLYYGPIYFWIKSNKPGSLKLCLDTVINTATSSQRVLLNKEILAHALNKNYFRLSLLSQGLGGFIHWQVLP